MIFYLFAVFILISFCVLSEKYLENLKLPVYYFLGIILILIAGFRIAGSDSDYYGYIKIFKGEHEYKNYRIEPTFQFIKYLINTYLNGKTVYLFLIYALIGVSIKLAAIKDLTELLFLSLLIYVSNFYILHDMTQIRVGVASGILLLSIKPLYQRNLKVFLLLWILASLFHYSSLIFVFFWLLKPDTYNYKIFLILIPISYALHYMGLSPSFWILNFPIEKVQQKLNVYLTIKRSGIAYAANLFNVLQLFRIATACLLSFYSVRIIRFNKYFYLIIKIYILAICITVLFADVAAIGARLSELLLITEILLVPMIIYVLKPKVLGHLVLITIALGFIWLGVFHFKLIQ